MTKREAETKKQRILENVVINGKYQHVGKNVIKKQVIVLGVGVSETSPGNFDALITIKTATNEMPITESEFFNTYSFVI